MTEAANAANRKFQKELSSGTTSLVLLAVLAEASDPLYGYQIAKQLEAGREEVPLGKQGSLYPVLRSLEKGGLLESEVEPSTSGPPRRYYRITGDGRRALGEWTAIWSRTRGFVDSILTGEHDVRRD